MANYKKYLSGITTFVFDYDGVFTDGIVYLTDKGEQIRTANAKDGYALQLANRYGYRICVITGANSKSITERFKKLGIEDIFMGSENKLGVYKKFCEKYDLKREEIVVMGDDIPDYRIMKQAIISCCPANASVEIREIADYISKFDGGKGCVRDIIEQVLRVQGRWMLDDSFSW